jgi:hypothetical protein
MLQLKMLMLVGAAIWLGGCGHAPDSSGGVGPAPKCDIPECFRAVVCVAECGGPVLSSSCCPCPEGSFDNITCPREPASAE